MKTDPANSDYTMERGGTRNYEPWRDKERTVAEAIAAREEEEKGNAMKVLRSVFLPLFLLAGTHMGTSSFALPLHTDAHKTRCLLYNHTAGIDG